MRRQRAGSRSGRRGRVAPPRLSAAQSGRGSGARRSQSGAAGAAPGLPRRPRRRDPGRARPERCGREGIPGPAPPALPRPPSRRHSGPAGGVSGNRARARRGRGSERATEGLRRWSGQGAGRPRGPSAAGAARPLAPGASLQPVSRGGATVPHAAGRQAWEEGGVRGRAPATLQSCSDPACRRGSAPACGSPGRSRGPEWGGDNRCPRSPPPLLNTRFGAAPRLRGVRRQDPSQDSQAHCPLDSAQRPPGPGGPRAWMEFPPRVAKQWRGRPRPAGMRS